MKVRFRSPKQQAPEREQGMRVSYAPAKRVMARWRWYLILILVSLPLIYLVGQILYGWLIVSAPGYVTLRKTPVNSQIAGVLLDLRVRTGETVSAGAVLARLQSEAMDGREAVLTAEREARERALAAAPKLSFDHSRTQRRLSLAAEMVAYRRRNRDDVQFLFEQGAATRAELQAAENRLHEALLNYENVEADLARMQAQIVRASATGEDELVRLQVVRAELAALHQAREALILHSPSAGRVLELLAEAGQSLAPGDPILLLGDTSQPEIVAYLDSRYAAYADKGQPVTVQFQNGLSVPGIVIRVPEMTRRLPAAVSSPMGSRENRLLVPIQLLPGGTPEHLVEGLPVTVRFPFRFFPEAGNGGLAISP
jgi:multidrug resistance efflux pump